jgi:hypothetical protein
VRAWLLHSDDQRCTPAWYLAAPGGGLEPSQYWRVGYLNRDGSANPERAFADQFAACAFFMRRQAEELASMRSDGPRVLHLSEHAAYGRIEAARAVRRFPSISGSVAAGQACEAAGPDPLGPETYKVQCTISRDTYERLRRAQDLLRHTIPNGDPAAILDRALTVLVTDLEKKKLAATAHPRAANEGAAGSRHVPAAVKREVWKRDAGQCAFEGTTGRCTERGFLEFHHIVPYARGGATT